MSDLETKPGALPWVDKSLRPADGAWIVTQTTGTTGYDVVLHRRIGEHSMGGIFAAERSRYFHGPTCGTDAADQFSAWVRELTPELDDEASE